MTIPTTREQLDWLLNRLYEAKRNLNASGVENPTFVLVTRNLEERQRIEEMVLAHFQAIYGIQIFENMNLTMSASTCSSFEFASHCMRVCLIDIEE